MTGREGSDNAVVAMLPSAKFCLNSEKVLGGSIKFGEFVLTHEEFHIVLTSLPTLSIPPMFTSIEIVSI